MEKYCISLDWFEAYCYIYDDTLLAGLDGITERRGFNVERAMCGGGRTFQYKYIVTQNKKEVASFVCHPYSSVIRPRACLLKLHNRVLYAQNWFSLFENLLSALSLDYKGISRLDLAYDCQFFKFHRNPQKFIKQYVSEDPDSPAYIHRKGSNAFGLRGRKRREKDTLLNYITWGAAKSRVRCYIYNKSLELKEVKEKPWIRQTWIDNGLNDKDLEPSQQPDIWRSEISISCQGFDLLNYDTGELFRLRPDYLSTQEKLEELFYIYAQKCFSFSQKGLYKRIRDYRPIQLFEKSKKVSTRPYFASLGKDTGRTEKVCINLLEKITTSYVDLVGHYNTSIADTIEILKILVSNKTLEYKSLRNQYAINHMAGREQLFNKRFEGFSGWADVFRLAAEIPQPLLDAVLAPEEKDLYISLQKTPDEINKILADLWGSNMQVP